MSLRSAHLRAAGTVTIRVSALCVSALCVAALLFAPATATAQTLCENPNGFCGKLLNRSCLNRLGAGSLEGRDTAAARACEKQLGAYRDCLASAAQCDARAQAETGHSCDAARAQSLFASAERAGDCLAYQAFVQGCPESPEAAMARAALQRLNCGAPSARDTAPDPEACTFDGAADVAFGADGSAEPAQDRLRVRAGPFEAALCRAADGLRYAVRGGGAAEQHGAASCAQMRDPVNQGVGAPLRDGAAAHLWFVVDSSGEVADRVQIGVYETDRDADRETGWIVTRWRCE